MSEAVAQPTTSDGSKKRKIEHPTKIKFSDALRSRIVKIKTREGPEFFVHEELLCQESEKFNKQLRGSFKEAQTGEITDCAESPELLGLFFQYIYGGGSLLDRDRNEVFTIHDFARLFCMAERLCANTFQNLVCWKFQVEWLNRKKDRHDIFRATLVLHTELPERKGDDYPIRKLVFSFAAFLLSKLKDIPEFKDTIFNQYPNLGCQLLMLAGDGPLPKLYFEGAGKPRPRFVEDVKSIDGASSGSISEVSD
ncbi:hypothetical protein HDK64DRAFT_275749 [Phyllosticta capitalensis]